MGVSNKGTFEFRKQGYSGTVTPVGTGEITFDTDL